MGTGTTVCRKTTQASLVSLGNEESVRRTSSMKADWWRAHTVTTYWIQSLAWCSGKTPGAPRNGCQVTVAASATWLASLKANASDLLALYATRSSPSAMANSASLPSPAGTGGASASSTLPLKSSDQGPQCPLQGSPMRIPNRACEAEAMESTTAAQSSHFADATSAPRSTTKLAVLATRPCSLAMDGGRQVRDTIAEGPVRAGTMQSW
mmetsp:Transcript_121943/g.242876  ORF Transcript_121943/g.242876 Transcript_121943/m.242876 type:complete len:209 (-) Transcript_121943:279-905(-)